MHAGEILLVIGLNCFILAGFQYIQGRVMERRLRNLKKEIQDLEDLVAAIIEEFEDVAVAPQDNHRAISDELTVGGSPAVVEEEPVKEEPPAPFKIEPVSSEVIAEEVQQPVLDSDAGFKATPQPHHAHAADPRHVMILELWQSGVPVEEIARKLGTGRGEVQLVLEIYHKI